MFGLGGIKVDRVIYQPGDTRVGASAPGRRSPLFYVLRGAGVVQAGEASDALAAGDVTFIPRGEFHWFENTGIEVFEMVEIWVPAPTQTIWADPDDP
ncbi:MAG TPA: cupin domain-containing protein [Egicoccus sp.]|nr:cupin domain-containing protein [Egicoccus sp.]HSK24871.1 cupin domain-containing protein [Egicoccus sp.]